MAKNMAGGIWSGADVDLLVCLNGTRQPLASEWTKLISASRAHAANIAGTSRVYKGFTISAGGTPDAQMRKQAAQGVDPETWQSAVISESVLMRSVLTAFRWIGVKGLFLFPPKQDREAFLFVGGRESEFEDFIKWLVDLGSQIDGHNPVLMLPAAGRPARSVPP